MYANSTEALLSDNVSKQLKYDDDKTEDSGRLVKVNKKEKKKKTEQKMYEYNDESAAEKLVASKKFVKSSDETQPKDKSKNDADVQLVRVERGGEGQCRGDEVDGCDVPSSAGDVNRDERHVPANDASSA